MSADVSPDVCPHHPGRGWWVVVPVKSNRRGKSRLGGPAAARARLADAFNVDTVAALLACPAVAGVLVMTDDLASTTALRDLGAVVETQSGVGLNTALREGLIAAATRDPGAPLAVVLGDLPALRPASVATALAAAAVSPGAVFVADADGAGTTVLADFHGIPRPAFGTGSRAAHLATGAADISALVPADIRRDVDTAADLTAALALGVGPATRAAAGR